MNITLNIPEETQEIYFEIAKERNITKEKLIEEAILNIWTTTKRLSN